MHIFNQVQTVSGSEFLLHDSDKEITSIHEWYQVLKNNVSNLVRTLNSTSHSVNLKGDIDSQ